MALSALWEVSISLSLLAFSFTSVTMLLTDISAVFLLVRLSFLWFSIGPRNTAKATDMNSNVSFL